MKTARKIIALLIVLTVMISGLSFASATSIDPAVTDQFIQMCNDIYANDTAYVIHDKNGIDITDSYYENTTMWYQEKDFTSIFLYYKNHVGQLIKYESIARGSF